MTIARANAVPLRRSAIVDDAEFALLDQAVSALDRLRRELGHGCIPIASIYVEGARGNLEHVRESLTAFRRRHGAPGWVYVDGRLEDDEPCQVTRDVGCDLLTDAAVRTDAERPSFAGRLATTLATNAFIHLASSTRWSTDASGANVLVSMLNGGRPFPLRDAADGSVPPDIAGALARHGWRRMRSSEWTA